LWQRVRFGNGEMQDLSNIRGQLSIQTASIALFLHLMSLGSQGRVERQLAQQLGALQDLQRSTTAAVSATAILSDRASSILMTYENDDKDFWKAFRRELIAEGCSSDVMSRHRELIVDYILELEVKGIYAMGEISEGDVKLLSNCLVREGLQLYLTQTTRRQTYEYTPGLWLVLQSEAVSFCLMMRQVSSHLQQLQYSKVRIQEISWRIHFLALCVLVGKSRHPST
jgi:hypothetical protein